MDKEKLSSLRKRAEDAGVEDFESLDRAGLLTALGETPAADETDKEGAEETDSEETKKESKDVLQETPTVSGTVPLPLGNKSRQMRDKLHAQKKVRVFIPLVAGEKQGVTQSVNINGYPMYIRKGEYVDVPESVAEVLEVKLKQKMITDSNPARLSADGQPKLTPFGN